MRIIVSLIAALLGVGLTPEVDAAEGSAGGWREDCSTYVNILEGGSGGDDLDVTYCVGQTVGIISALLTGAKIGAVSMASSLTVAFQLDSEAVFTLFRAREANSLLGVCLPETSRTSEHIQVVYAYLAEYPDKVSLPVAAVFFEALKNAYPCDAPE